jgi:hypothetical protein
MNPPRLGKTILWSGCAPAVCMPAALIQREAQPLSFVNFRVRIRDLQSIPAYRFSRATVFILPQNPRRNIELTSSVLPAVYLIFIINIYMILYCLVHLQVLGSPRSLPIPTAPKCFWTTNLSALPRATLRRTEGMHTLILKSPHHADWQRSITVLKDSAVTVNAMLNPIER